MNSFFFFGLLITEIYKIKELITGKIPPLQTKSKNHHDEFNRGSWVILLFYSFHFYGFQWTDDQKILSAFKVPVQDQLLTVSVFIYILIYFVTLSFFLQFYIEYNIVACSVNKKKVVLSKLWNVCWYFAISNLVGSLQKKLTEIQPISLSKQIDRVFEILLYQFFQFAVVRHLLDDI